MENIYDIAIVGAGPSGLTAALYARRAGKSVLVIEKSTFGGQITHSPRVENYPCFKELSGVELADMLVDQVLSQGAEIEMETVTGITGEGGNFTVKCENAEYGAKAVIIASGSEHRRLGLPREEELTGEGVSYCAVCDGAFYKDGVVAVIGGGNTALQEAVMLSDICKKVYVVQNLAFLTGEELLARELEKRPNVEIIFSSTVTQLLGDGSLEGIKIASPEGERELAVDGVFVAVGQKPENEPFKNVVPLDEYGYISAGESCVPENSAAGIYAAGDCRTKAVRQVTTAAADGAVAALAACRFVDSLK